MEGSALLLALFFIGLIASWIGGFISGGVSLVGVTGMMLLGLPAQVTMPAYFVGSLAARTGHFREYLRADKIVWRHVFPLSFATFLGSMVGAHILLTTDPPTVKSIINWVILLFVPLAFIKTRLGIERIKVSRRREYVGYVVYFLIAAWTGFFAAWAGLLMLYAYLLFFGMTILEIKGTDSIPGAFLDIGALVVFLQAGSVHIPYALAFAPGMIIGTVLGARTALKLGNNRLQLLVRVSVTIISLKVIVQLKIIRPILSLFGIQAH